MRRWSSKIALPGALFALIVSGCGGAATSRPEPPSGAVDIRTLQGGLATPSSLGGSGSSAGGGCSGPGCGDPAIPAGLGALGGAAGLDGAARGAGEPSSASSSSSSEAQGKITMTREHCETLGRKFAELAGGSGGMEGLEGFDDGGGSSRESSSVGRDFAAKCARDLVGQPVEAREFQCLLRAKSANDLTACKR